MHDFIDLLKVPEADRAVVVSVNVSNGFDLTPDVTGGLARVRRSQ